MLILTRNIHEKIIITTPEGRVIVIGVGKIDCNNNAVAIGIGAEREVTIDREEIHIKKQEEAACRKPPLIPKSAGSLLSLKKP